MKLEDIMNMWSEDAGITRDKIVEDSINTSKLHAKYLKIYINERNILKARENDLKVLKKDKHEFYTMGPTPETQEKGWKLPPQGKIIKTEVAMYIDSDPDMIALTQKIEIQRAKVDFCSQVIDVLSRRSFTIKNIIDYEKFISGAI